MNNYTTTPYEPSRKPSTRFSDSDRKEKAAAYVDKTMTEWEKKMNELMTQYQKSNTN